MFKNIGRKIKGLTKVLFWLGFVFWIMAGLAVMAIGILTTPVSFDGSDSFTATFFIFIVLGILVIGIGFLISWISCFFMYGYGELIDKTAEIAKNTAEKTEYFPQIVPTPTVPATEEAVITE